MLWVNEGIGSPQISLIMGYSVETSICSISRSLMKY